MYGHYLKLAISFAGLMFVTGFICLAVLSVTKVLPARKGLSFEEATCRVAHSEISCESGKCVCNGRGCLKDEDIPCLKVYVLCGSGDDKVVNRSVYSDKQEGNLLRKDIKHLKDEVTIIFLVFTLCHRRHACGHKQKISPKLLLFKFHQHGCHALVANHQ